MGILILIIYFVLLGYMRISNMDKGSKRILFIFVTYWFAALYISTYGPYGFILPSDKTLIILLTSVLSFVVGFSIIKINKNATKDINETQIPTEIDNIVKKPLFIIAFFVALVYVLFLIKQFYAQLMFTGSLGEVRENFYSGNLYGPYHDYIEIVLLYPIYALVTPIFGYKIINKRDFWFYIILLYLFVYASLAGGRLGYIRMALPIVLCAFCLRKDSFLKKNPIKKIIGAIGAASILILFMIITSTMRNGNIQLNKESLEEGWDIASEQMITYSSGPTVAFDYALSHKYLERLGGYQYGLLTLSGFENIYYTTVGKLVPYTRPINEFMKIKQYERISLSREVNYWNALYTWVMFFYLDFGFLGVIVIPFIIGLMFRKLIKHFYRAPSFQYFSLVNLIFIFIILSVLDYFMIYIYQIVMIILLLYWGKKKERKMIR